MSATSPALVRIVAAVERDEFTGCWNWTGTTTKSGYGNISIRQKTLFAHRVAHELMVGPIPDGFQVDHLCRNTRCVNPDHLEAVTPGENTRRAFAVKGKAAHCKRGHELTRDNTYSRGDRRRCRICTDASNAAYKARVAERDAA